MRRLREWWWVPLLYTLAVIWIYRDLWQQHGVATGLGWDTIDTHGPDLDFFSREIREGRFSLWNPYDKGGYPIFCDPVFDRYYPLNWPFGLWGALFGTSWWLVQIKVLAHHVLAGVAMHIFLRSRNLSHRAAMVAGLGLIACAPLLTHKASNILWPLAWVPLVWLAVDFALARPSWRRGVAVGAALLPCMTAGSPPGLFYAGLLILPYAGWRFTGAVRRETLAQLAICVGAAVAIAALIAAVTIVPTSELVALGSRDRFAPPGRAFALALSMPMGPEFRGVFVRGAGLFEFYMGATVVLLALCAVALRPKFDRGAAIVLLATALLGLVLAGGANGRLLTFLVDHVPGFGMLRVPGRYKLLAAWSFAACAGYGVAALEGARLRRTSIVVGAMVLLAILCVIGWAHPASPKDRPAWLSILATLIPATLILVAVWRPRFRDVALSALALCALLDAPFFTFVLPNAPPAADVRQTHARDAEVVAKLDGAHDRWRIYDEFVLGERAGARLRLRDFRGYPALDPISLKRYVEVLDFTRRDAGILADFNVRWLLSRPHFRYGYSTTFAGVPHPEFDARGNNLYEAKHPAPLIQWVGAYAVTPRRDVLPSMRAVLEPDGARRKAIVEPADARGLPASGEPDAREGTLISYEPDEIQFTIDAPHDGLVVLNEILFPGWHVTVDGGAASPVRANYLMRAVWVKPGHHTITWTFSPRRWRLLVGCYILALIMIAGVGIEWLIRRRRRC
jgi:hypothetical protein